MRQLTSLDAQFLEDDAFNLEFHVRELALPAPGDDHQLAEQVARLVARPTRPRACLSELQEAAQPPAAQMF